MTPPHAEAVRVRRPHTPADDTVLTVRRGMQVLRAFRGESRPLSNVDLVGRTGLPKSTISRLTSTLIALGYLRRAAGGRQFELSMAPLGIGNAFLETSVLVRLAHPFMQDLADRLNVSVALGTANDLDMLYLGYRISRRISTLRLGIGSLLRMDTTAIGRAYLWGLPAQEREPVVARLLGAAGQEAPALNASLQASFHELRDSGTCFMLGVSGLQRNAYGIAAPVRVGPRGTVMALSCGSVENGGRLEAARMRVSQALREAAPEFERLVASVDYEA